ncbi:MFS transporter [Xanthobacter sp. DSM 24535]|uniref:MFS transporter n=1 Tax=Roseixanthobacter psychrophilus TaxID=3119917 RepID=UPI00372C96D4
MTAPAAPSSVGSFAEARGGADRPGMSTKVILAGTLGNTLEWYDFAAYGFLASVFAKNFFPDSDTFVGLIAAFGIFAASFLMRPLGGVIFGHIGDRYGRRHALLISVALMCVSTVTIGLLPTYATAGVLAPCLLLVMRLLQGISIGGEYTTSAIFLAENSSVRWRGFLTSFSCTGATGGILLGSAVAALTAAVLTPEALIAWGWRVPFLLGIALGLTTLSLRRNTQELEAPAAKFEEPPLVQAFVRDGRNIARAVALNAMLGVGFYMLFVYLTTYMRVVDHMSERLSLEINTLSMLVLLVLCPVFAALTDVVGRKVVMVAALGALLLAAWPLFRMLSSGTPGEVLTAQIAFAVLVAGYAGPMPVVLAEMFRKETRCSAMSVGYNIAVGLAGGTAPMIAVYLVNRLHDDMGPALYLIAAAAVSLVAALTITDRARQPLP